MPRRSNSIGQSDSKGPKDTITEKLKLLKQYFPACSCCVTKKAGGIDSGFRLLFLVRTNGKTALIYDPQGNPYSLSLEGLNIREIYPPFVLTEDSNGYSIAVNQESGYTYRIGPLHKFDPNMELGYIESMVGTKRAGGGSKLAMDLIAKGK